MSNYTRYCEKISKAVESFAIKLCAFTVVVAVAVTVFALTVRFAIG